MSTGLSTQDKALKINLDNRIYGTFAEIGAGQEVGRWFFRAGAASKTIAKTMSAYDMTFSDAIYGPEKSGRYVCESRLIKMLDHEYQLLEERLWDKRSSTTTFFAFADTVAATSFKKHDQEGRGWIGVRFQRKIQGEANEIILHVRLFDKEALHQQEQLGILGVNLIYGAFFLMDDPVAFLQNMNEGLKEGAVEIEMIRVSGPDVAHIDNRVLALKMIEQRLTNAVLFDPQGHVAQPSDVLFKKNVLVQRGSFRPFTLLHQDMMEHGREQFCNSKAGGCDPTATTILMEMTTKNLSRDTHGVIEYQDFLDRIEILNSLGHYVLVTDYAENYNLRQYLGRYSHERVGILMGAIHLAALFDPKYYTKLRGGVLEAFGLLFDGDVKLYIYPAKNTDGKLITAQTFLPNHEVKGLFDYLKSNGKIIDLENVSDKFVHIIGDELVAKIKKADVTWKDSVPSKVADIITKRNLFKK